jgi:hypothetical protein
VDVVVGGVVSTLSVVEASANDDGVPRVVAHVNA